MNPPDDAGRPTSAPACTRAGGHPTEPLPAPPSPYTDAATAASHLLTAMQRTKARRERFAGGAAAQSWDDAVLFIRNWRETQRRMARLAALTPAERAEARHHHGGRAA